MRRALTMAVVVFGLGACGDDNVGGADTGDTTDPDFGTVDLAVKVAVPEGLTDLCFALRISSGHNRILEWEQGLCSSAYSAGAVPGELLYVLPCDGDAPEHTVTLWIEEPAQTDLAATWRNPCRPPSEGDPRTWFGSCTYEVTCVPGGTARLDVNL